MPQPEIAHDGERMIPALDRGSMMYGEHVVRYQFAAQFAPGCRVLDVACGVGYGSSLMAQAGATAAVGLDRSPQAVAYASAHFGGSGAHFVQGDAQSVPFADDSFDVCVSFETVEHLDDPAAFVRELARVLAPGGILVISTPNKAVYPAGNPFHVHELSVGEFRDVLGASFPNTQVLTQNNWIGSGVMAEPEPGAPQAAMPVDVVDGRSLEESLYVVAVCSGAEIPAYGQTVVLSEVAEYQSVFKEIRSREVEMARLAADRETWRSSSSGIVADRDRWKARGLDAERRYREREVALRHLRADLDEVRIDRDHWRAHVDRLTAALGTVAPPGPPRHRDPRERIVTAAKRVARATWAALPEPGRRIARPVLEPIAQRVRERIAPPPAPAPPAVEAPAPEAQALVLEPTTPAPALTVAETVSVIIPTLNAGPEFARTLDAIVAQEGVRRIELLVVDSGSTDGTLEVARSRGARVTEIRPVDFSHGGTRNDVAQTAAGDMLLMTVQDAVLAGPHAIRDLVLLLNRDPTLAAVSARQVPRVDCDLFGAFTMFAHTRATLRRDDAEDLLPWYPMLLAGERRTAGSVDNVCALYRRHAWEALGFRDVAFGEDLDFGIRAVESGWAVGIANGVSVIHSHSRGARYHLSRFLVDRLCLSAFLGDPDMNPAAAAGLDVVAAGAVEFLGQVEAARMAGAATSGEIDFGSYLRGVLAAFEPVLSTLPPTGEVAELLEMFEDYRNPAAVEDRVLEGLHLGMLYLLRSPVLAEFAALHPLVDRSAADGFIARGAALVIGQVVGEAIRDTAQDSPLIARLTAGV